MIDGRKTWRSIRSYLDRQINEDSISNLLSISKDKIDKAGDKAWSYTVIQNKKLITNLNKVIKKDMIKKSTIDIIKRLGKTPDFDMFYGAPTVIMISVKDTSKAIGNVCGDVIHKIVNDAKALGLSASWNSFIKYYNLNTIDLEDSETLNIPKDYTPYYAISIGYPS